MTTIDNGSSGSGTVAPVIVPTTTLVTPVIVPVTPVVTTATQPATTTLRTGLLDTLGRMAQGMSTTLPSGSALTVNSQSLTQAQILTELNGFISAGQAAATQAVQLAAARATWRAQQASARVLVANLKKALVVFLGDGNPLLATFGIAAPKKAAKLTSQAATLRAARSKATRALRGTKGSAQKAAIRYTGDVQLTVTTAQNPTGSVTNAAGQAQAQPAAQQSGTTPAVATVGSSK